MTLAELHKKATAISLAAFAFSLTSTGQNRADGFYKDIFMDSGIYLTSRVDLPAARFLNMSMEEFVSTSHKDTTTSLSAIDTLLQKNTFVGSDIDQNGVLLYPDGEPRFKVLYINGGRATSHGRSLSPEGVARIREYIMNGGSVVGTCAGAFFASAGTYTDSVELNPHYSGIYPGLTRSTRLAESQTDMDIEPGSALLKYYDFGGDMKVDSVRHNGGCFAYTGEMFPSGTEILARYQTGDRELKRRISGEPSIWAYKADAGSGRVVSCGSHPEGVTSGERLELMSAMLLYAIEGNGAPKVKAELKSGEVRDMTGKSSDGDPSHTAIGDRQYHHFLIDVPAKTASVTITLTPKKGYENFDLYLYAAEDELCFNDNATFKNVGLGAAKTLTIDSPAKGRLYVSVFCDDTVEATQTRWGTQYSGMIEVLNGVPYSIGVEMTSK
ncbi:MAG: BPL-N domain-containing protein [Bacteroidales bacterium]|nr:BPL-N domain-containing protein [Bacteroidales bacterium]